MTVITVTLNPAIDKTFSVDRVVPDRKLSATDIRRYPGGGGINVARVVTRFGGHARALWNCGGYTGDVLGNLLDDEQVPHEPVPIRDEVRENLIVQDSDGQQYRFGMPGPELTEPEREAWRRRLQELSPPPDYAVFSGSIPGNTPAAWYGDLLRALPAHTRVVVDTKQEALGRALEAGVYLVKPNVNELQDTVGRELTDDDLIEQAAREVIDRRCAEVVLVSLGRKGALLVTATGAERFSAPSVRVRSKVGAGDSMVGGMVWALTEGRSLSQAARFAVAAGAAAVMTEGTELCRREDTEHLYGRMGWETFR